MIEKNKYNEILNQLENKKFIVEGNNIYFIGEKNIATINCTFLCRIALKYKKLYVLNKTKNHVTDSYEIYQDYLKRKADGIRGYKTIKIGMINNYVYFNRVEYACKGSDITGFYWMTDWKNQIKINMEVQENIKLYINNLSSEFISA